MNSYTLYDEHGEPLTAAKLMTAAEALRLNHRLGESTHRWKVTEPSPEQLTALRAFAKREGRNWKQELRDAWYTGRYPHHAQSGYLQQVRNQLGPSWLERFSLPTEKV